MLLKFEPLNLLITCLIAANVIGILAYLILVIRKRRLEQKNVAAITAALTEYFQRTGVKVTADCAILRGHGQYTAVIESEPMKRFRLSHMIESALRDHVRKTCNLDLEKVFWRFPINESIQEGPASGLAEPGRTKTAGKSDEYINEGLEYYKYIPKVEVTELPWEKFEEASTIGPKNSSGVD